MNKDWYLSQEDFDALLQWLDSDREQAAVKYEDIRKRLIKIFTGRACVEAEDLADETINRVISKLHELGTDFEGDRRRYFFGVANKVYLESKRKKKHLSHHRTRLLIQRESNSSFAAWNDVLQASATRTGIYSCNTTAWRDEQRSNGENAWQINWRSRQTLCA